MSALREAVWFEQTTTSHHTHMKCDMSRSQSFINNGQQFTSISRYLADKVELHNLQFLRLPMIQLQLSCNVGLYI